MEAETAVTKLQIADQDYIRCLIARNTELLYKQYNNNENHNTQKAHAEMRIINIETKLSPNNAIVLKADKRNTVVICYTNDYYTKAQEFILINQFSTKDKDPTNIFRKEIRSVVNNCTNVIHKEEKWKYINLNPSAPSMKGLPKIHKINSPVRPIVNWQNAPAYKLAKPISKLLKLYIPLPNAFNVKNSMQLMKDLEDIPIDKNTRLASFDTANMYSNVPTYELTNIIKFMRSLQNLNDKLTEELISLTHTIINQNYFEFHNKFYVQNTGLAMGAPTSSVLSEIYLQFMEHNKLYTVLLQNNILGYFRYVDDILIVYNGSNTDIDKLLLHFNNTIPTMTFSIEKESDNSINFLDITVHMDTESFSFSIYRKPTTTDIIIPNDSCHPPEHKHAAIRYMLNRMNNYQLNKSSKEQEYNTIKQIMHNNKYDPSILNNNKNKTYGETGKK